MLRVYHGPPEVRKRGGWVKEVRLSPRMTEVLVMIGRDRLTYKRIAKELGISPETVRDYAVTIRARIGTELPPRDALTAYYWKHQKKLDNAAA